ncbi:hypothetical protein QUD12_05420 [Staphylococcus hyicus]|uniref:hypothetical protein n=1 Tax=Staphylococcus hyicus TaxID=1284 RepID=UPI0027392594|nr:hypothetical protein [Staphylococcus hyicus]MDP4448487.1 hypothetical protein [Staphylococcus hyicus]
MDSKVTIKDIKKEWYLDVDTNITNIAEIIGDAYKEYVIDPSEYKGDKVNYKELHDSCSHLQPQLVPYSILTEIIFRNDMSEKNMSLKDIAETSFASILQANYEKFLNDEYGLNVSESDRNPFANKRSIDKNKIEKDKNKIVIVYKMIEHIKLAISQKEGLYERQLVAISELNTEIDKNKSTVDKLEKSINKVADMEESLKGVYPQFVAILGIFTSIMFAVLGGFNEMKTLAQSITSVPIPKLLIFTSLLMLGINFLVFLSYNAISKLTKLPLKSCGCEGACNCLFRKKHPTVFYSSMFFIYVMFIGFALRIYKYNDFTFGNMFDDFKNNDILPLILLIIPPLLLLAWLVYTNYKAEESETAEVKLEEK